MDEQLLIDGCKRGEASARKELYELYAPAMMSVCARYVHEERRPAICSRMDLSKYSPKYRPIRRLAPLALGYEGYL